jgi:C4-dicarboxylate-specific signal transduction histidine kinase
VPSCESTIDSAFSSNALVGAIIIVRARVQPFTDTQIDLTTDFAAQAAIALESTRRERRYRETQMALAHVNRVATTGQLTASITHEVNQPIGAARNNVSAALHFLDRNPPDLQRVREALAFAVKDTDRAGAIVGRMRALMQNASTRTDRVDINEAVREVIELTRGEALKNGVSRPNWRMACLLLQVIASNFNKSSLTSFSTPCKQWRLLMRELDRRLSPPVRPN